MKKLIVLLTTITLLFSCKSNYTKIGGKNANYIPYYLKVYEADSLFIVNDFKGSYKILDSLFKKYEPVNLDIYEECLTYVLLKKKLKLKIKSRELKSLISDYGYTFERLKGNELSTSALSKKYKIWRSNYLAKIDYSLRDTIVSMKRNDQKYRGSNFNNNVETQKILDDFNTLKIKSIFEKYGYPNRKIIGNDVLDYNNESNKNKVIVNHDILSILLHSSKDERKDYILPKIKIFLAKGTANPLVYARIVDQMMLYDNLNQSYGSYENEIKEDEVVKINKNRALIGLPNYGYEKWRREIKYPRLF